MHTRVKGDTRMLRPKALDHVALKVTDMDKPLHFYHLGWGCCARLALMPKVDGRPSLRLVARRSTCFTVPIVSRPIRRIQ